ncbi:hypothetical protein L2744_14500 [Shewanella profunda]|uniref:hypothetical protein n=1 Tax=Shewanella profunda TaxID=254793 RepID=UPI00200BE623|nr:hypothetical protein [Shewanella profunda]MCL1090784.1 hypothetical protein [Shewanella profunda]
MPLNLQDSLSQTAHLFRLGQEAQASVELRLCLDLIEKHCPEIIQNSTFRQILPLMLQAQEQHDWLNLADYLEYELMALI